MDTDLSVRIVQKNKQIMTIIDGLDASNNYHYILTSLCTALSCTGSILRDPETGTSIQLNGNHQDAALQWLMNEGYLGQN